MLYIDIHTHKKVAQSGTIFVRNAYDFLSTDSLLNLGYPISVGTHPWHIGDDFLLENALKYLENTIGLDPVYLIGEIGLDRKRGNFQNQLKYLEGVWEINRKYQKPILLHLVGAEYDIIPWIRKANFPIIWHGFYPKGDLIEKLLVFREKLMFSLGKKIFLSKEEISGVLRTLPLDMLLCESDNSGILIEEIYQRISKVLDLEPLELKNIIWNNFNKLRKYE